MGRSRRSSLCSTRTWRRCAAAAVLLAAAFPLTGCTLSPQYLACLASNSLGTIDCNADAVSPGPPDAPLELTASVDFTQRIRLEWAANREPDLHGYFVYRAEVRGGPYEHIGHPMDTLTGYIDSGYRDSAPGDRLVPCRTYYYVVTAVDGEGQESRFSAPAGAYLDAPVCHPPRPPEPPTGLVALPHDGSVQLMWNPSVPEVAGFHVYRSPAQSGTFALAARVRGDSYLDEGLTNGATLYYRVTAVDADGAESAPSAVVSATPTAGEVPPARPTGLTATPGETTVHLDWADNTEADLAGYVVTRSANPDGSPPSVRLNSALVTASEYTDTGLANGVPVYYFVQAQDRVGLMSLMSAVVGATPVDLPPAAPVGLAAAPGEHGIALDWNDNAEHDLAGYNVYRALETPQQFAKVNAAPVAESRYTDSGVASGVPAFYRVTAVDGAGHESDPSATVSVTGCAQPGCGTASFLSTLGGRRSRPPRPVAFTLVVAGRYTDGGTTRVDGTAIAGTGAVYEGSFGLRLVRAGVARGPARRPLRGLWRSKLDWRLDPTTHTGGSNGIMLATFPRPRAGRACLRFVETYSFAKQGDGKQRLVAAGTFTSLGGTGRAARLLGRGGYRVSIRRDGGLLYRGAARPVAVKRGLPPECLALVP